MSHRMTSPSISAKSLLKQISALLLVLFLSNISVNAQLIEAGMNFGYHISKFKLKENKLSDQVFVKEGRASGGYSLGVQYMLGPPIPQSTPRFRIIHSMLLESSVCRCGGNIELSLTNPDGTRSFRALEYLIYRGDFSGKYVANIKNLQLMVGPTITSRYYTGVRINSSESLGYAGDQFKTLAFGYEFGVGAKLNAIQLSMRYHGLIGPWGKETAAIPTAYKNYQLRFMIHYFFLKKHKGQNWGSIYWD